MKIVIVNPKVLINKKRGEINDVVDQALINWLLLNNYNPLILPNSTIGINKKKSICFYQNLI